MNFCGTPPNARAISIAASHDFGLVNCDATSDGMSVRRTIVTSIGKPCSRAKFARSVATSSEGLDGLFAQTVSSNWRPLLFMLLFVGTSSAVLLAGVKDGIEKYSKVLMPLLFLMVIIIAVRSVTLPAYKFVYFHLYEILPAAKHQK